MSEKLAHLLFPQISDLPENFVYPPRQEKVVTRFAPSPTGFLHIGWVYTALIAERFAHMNDWIFFLRIEDTDQKRLIPWTIELIVQWLEKFGIQIDEGPTWHWSGYVWEYGPYIQSQREHIYKAFVKDLIRHWKAYPCFLSELEIDEIRKQQTADKKVPWIYWQYSPRADASYEDIEQAINEWKEFVIRFRAPNQNLQKRVKVFDELRWEMETNDNAMDIVLLKSSGLPTYHLAHAVDDHLMWTTHVIRAEEWLPSLPLHYQLFEALGFEKPKYIHLSPLLKVENWNKRKLSKRKDMEADISYFFEQGYPIEAIIDYLMTIVDPFYEEKKSSWQIQNFLDYKFDITKLNRSGAIVDMTKLESISKEYISNLSDEELFEAVSNWAQEYDENLAQEIVAYPELAYKALWVERGWEKDPKRIAKWKDAADHLSYFFHYWYESKQVPDFPSNLTQTHINWIIKAFMLNYHDDSTKDEWYNILLNLCENFGFAQNNKQLKEMGWVAPWKLGDIAMALRIMIAGSNVSPDLYELMQVIGKEEVSKRLQKFAQ